MAMLMPVRVSGTLKRDTSDVSVRSQGGDGCCCAKCTCACREKAVAVDGYPAGMVILSPVHCFCFIRSEA